MAGSQCLGIPDCGFAKSSIVPLQANQARPGAFIEGQTKPGLRCGRYNGLVDVLDGLDKVGLADDDVGFIRNFHGHCEQIDHGFSFAAGVPYTPFLCCVRTRST